MRLFNSKKYRVLSVFIAAIMLFASMTATAFANDYTQEDLEALREIIVDFYVDPLTTDMLPGETPQEIFSNLDEHSVYYTAKEFEGLFQRYTGDYAGIGAYIIEEDGKIIIERPIEGSPAERAGLLPGDEIYSVDGEIIRGLNAAEGAERVKGPVGTKVTLGIIRGNNERVIEFTIVRANITNNPVSYEIIDDIGYIKIEEFNGHAYENFAKAVGQLAEQRVKQAIIDLRDNPGGGLEEVVKIARLLVPPSPIVHIGYRGFDYTYASFSTLKPFDDIVVLVNEYSASASEILAAAVQDTGSGTIIGKNTYGKGTVQQIFGLTNDEGFKITVARYLSPNRNIIDGRGVIPDIEVERLPQDIQIEEFLPISYSNTYSLGDVSSEIAGVQQRLRALGYNITDKAGVLDQGTLDAINTFAKDYELEEMTDLTTEMQSAIEYIFVSKLYSKEYDLQLKAALEYIKEGFKR